MRLFNSRGAIIAMVATWYLSAAPHAFAIVGSSGTGQFVLYGAHPPAAGGPSINMCIDVPMSQFQAGMIVQPYQCNGTYAQQWTVNDKTFKGQNGTSIEAYTISPSTHPELCLDVEFANYQAGTVQLWYCNGTPAQAWLVGTQLVAIGGMFANPSPPGQGGNALYCMESTTLWDSIPPGGLTTVLGLQSCNSTVLGQAIVPTGFPLAITDALTSSFFVNQPLSTYNLKTECLNVQSWGPFNAATLNMQGCQAPALAQGNNYLGQPALPGISVQAPPSTQVFTFTEIIGGSGAQLHDAALPNQCVFWNGDASNPIALVTTSLCDATDARQSWWVQPNPSAASFLGGFGGGALLANGLIPQGVGYCLNNTDSPYEDGVAVNPVVCPSPSSGVWPRGPEWEISGMWR